MIMSNIEYTSETPFGVWCLFRNDSDGYTYFCEVLTGVFLTQEDAETALLELTEKAKVLFDIDETFRRRMKESYKDKKNFAALQEIAQEQIDWYNSLGENRCIPDHLIENYEIRFVEIGQIL